MAYDFDGQRAQIMVIIVAQRLTGGNHNALACVYTQRIEIFHVAYGDAIVISVAYHLVLDFFPAFERFFDKHLRGKGQSFLRQSPQFFGIIAKSATKASQGVCRTHYDRITQFGSHIQSLRHTVGGTAAYGLDTYLVQALDKKLTILGVNDSLHRCAEHLYAVALEDAVTVQLDATIQRRLPAEGQQDTVGTLFLNNLGHKIWRHGQEVDFVGKALGGLHSGYIGIDQNSGYALFLHGLERLRSRIIKFAGFAYFECTAAQ